MHPRSLPLLLLLLLAGCSDSPSPAAPLPPVRAEAAPAGAWKAEIRVKLSGCTSCAECRAGIRQVSRTRSGSDQVEFKDGIARVVYPAPAPVRAEAVAQGLCSGGLLKVKVDRVDLSLAGEIRGETGARRFVAAGTGQTWEIAEDQASVPSGRPVLLNATLEGWRDGTAKLRIRSADPAAS